MKKLQNYTPIIGLEIHVELTTKSKMFCQCLADHFAKKPNTQTCPVCLGMPGALPVPNQKAVEWTILLARALNCTINKESKFDRKHYFYPDLPKGYQISQYDLPFGKEGWLELPGDHLGTPGPKPKELLEQKKRFRITRVHLEEDTGKLQHHGSETLIDFNRSGVPLMEIVTEPDFRTAEDVKQFLEELQVLIRYLGISGADMEKGSMRLEPNISLMKLGIRNEKLANSKKEIVNRKGQKAKSKEVYPAVAGQTVISKEELPDYKVEVKNINSFNFVKKAIEFEIERQAEILEQGKKPTQETRGWDSSKGVTVSQRTKEEAHDYRYFPEPDIPPFIFTDQDIKAIEKDLPELPLAALERLVKQYDLKLGDAYVLTRDKQLVAYFGQAVKALAKEKLANGDLPQKIANLIVNKKVSPSLSLDQFVAKAINELQPKQADSGQLAQAVNEVIKNNEKAVNDYKAGQTNAVMFLVGQVMREMKGQADANAVKEALEKLLKN